MINELNLISHNAGLTLSLLATVGATLAETAATTPMAEYTAQGALVVALCFVVRYLIGSQKEHKAEMATTRDKHEALISKIHLEGMESSQRREDLMRGAIEKQSLTMQELVSQSREQTDYFREVTQAAVISDSALLDDAEIIIDIDQGAQPSRVRGSR